MTSNWRFAIFALVLWAQLLFGLGLTLWRDTLTLAEHWQIYSVSLPADLNHFAEFATRTIPPRGEVAYLSPPSDKHMWRYSRLAVWLYPRRLIWLGVGPAKTPTTGWIPLDLNDANWLGALRARDIRYLLIEDLADTLPCSDECIRFDAARYLWALE